MKFELDRQSAKLTKFTPYRELHGEEPSPGTSLHFECTITVDELAKLSPDFARFTKLYGRDSSQVEDLADQGADAPHFLFEKLSMPLTWDAEQVGGDLTIHYGASERSAIVLTGVVTGPFKIELLTGRAVVLGFRVKAHPDEKQAGKLYMLQDTEHDVTLEAPESDQPDLATSAEPVFTQETLQE